MPPKKPCPNSRPNKPAPRNPAARPPNKPPPKRPEPVTGDPKELLLPGCVIERVIGAAVPGAVRVVGGMENVRMPRLPKENPPPARACASPASKTTTVTIAPSAIKKRLRNIERTSRPKWQTHK